MNPAGRALSGALLGAVAVLLVHPTTRPAFQPLGSVFDGRAHPWTASRWRLANVRVAPPLTDDVTAAYWLQIGADQRSAGTLSDKEAGRLARLAEREGAREPDNAFWHHAAAWYAHLDGRPAAEAAAWRAGSLALRWNDRQTERMQRVATEMARADGAELPWHWHALYAERSPRLAEAVARRGIQRLWTASGTSELGIRAESLANAVLLRDGGRRIELARHGIDWIEATARESPADFDPNRRRLMISRYALVDRYRAADREADAVRAVTAFSDNDAWLALVPEERADEHRRRAAVESLVRAVAPSAMLAAAAGAAVVALIACGLRRLDDFLSVLVAPRSALVAAVGMGAGVYAATGRAVESAWLAACLAFFSLVPTSKRRTEPEDLGPLFATIAGGLGIGLATIAALAFARQTTVWTAIASSLGDHPLRAVGVLELGWLAAVIGALLACVAPAWSMVQRYPVPAMVRRVLSTAGTAAAWTMAATAVVIALVGAVGRPSELEQARRLALNEAAYHLAHGHERR